MDYKAQYVHSASSGKLLYELAYLMTLNIDVKDILDEASINTVAIYGAGNAGEILARFLMQHNVKVAYMIDRNSKRKIMNLPMLDVEKDWPLVDLIIVATDWYYDEIVQVIESKCTMKYTSLRYFIDEVISSSVDYL